ncbi:MAG: UDP-N-acetylmuramoyl-L-alanyl-D-glutamate--2,6-diaminopimelate ligase [Phycisphaerales bacterium]
MRLDELTAGLGVRLPRGAGDVVIRDVTDDSRRVTAGSLFIARPGAGSSGDGARFAGDAVSRGAVAVVSGSPLDLPPQVASLIADDITRLPGALAERFFGRPAQHLQLIAITGTKGKTTTAYMIRHLLNTAGQKCGLIGTVEIDDGRSTRPATLTTPGAIELTRILADMVAHGCVCCVMECSSHALHQKRVSHLPFQIGVFTNLAGDHLDYHKTMTEYADAKAILFEQFDDLRLAVVNVCDPAASHMTRHTRARIIRYGVCESLDPVTEYTAQITRADARGCDLLVRTPADSQAVRLPAVGKHNVLNLLAAVAAVEGAGRSLRDLLPAIAAMPPVPGRLEPVHVPGFDMPFTVLVDYAHTDDSLRNVLLAMRPFVADTPGTANTAETKPSGGNTSGSGGRLRVMFGCGGDRDRSKRPRMALVACELADDIVITSDNPRTEDPRAIIGEILVGVPDHDHSRVQVIPDRRAAIEKVLTDARPGDVVLLAGKGHEDYQIIGDTKHPFDDRLEAGVVLNRLFGMKPSRNEPQRHRDTEE